MMWLPSKQGSARQRQVLCAAPFCSVRSSSKARMIRLLCVTFSNALILGALAYRTPRQVVLKSLRSWLRQGIALPFHKGRAVPHLFLSLPDSDRVGSAQ